MEFLEVMGLMQDTGLEFTTTFHSVKTFTLEVKIYSRLVTFEFIDAESKVSVEVYDDEGAVIDGSIQKSEFKGFMELLIEDKFKYPIELYLNNSITQLRFWQIMRDYSDLAAVIKGDIVEFYHDEVKDDNLIVESTISDF